MLSIQTDNIYNDVGLLNVVLAIEVPAIRNYIRICNLIVCVNMLYKYVVIACIAL